MDAYRWYRSQRLAEEYAHSASYHFGMMAICGIVMGLCVLFVCLCPTLTVILMCSFMGFFGFSAFIWHWIEGESDKQMARDIRMWGI